MMTRRSDLERIAEHCDTQDTSDDLKRAEYDATITDEPMIIARCACPNQSWTRFAQPPTRAACEPPP
jgi:hypothetical protein